MALDVPGCPATMVLPSSAIADPCPRFNFLSSQAAGMALDVSWAGPAAEWEAFLAETAAAAAASGAAAGAAADQ